MKNSTNTQAGLALSMKEVSKQFPGTLAVDKVSFELKAGEVHALLGENGAGKSTLMRILAGSYNDYSGDIMINDEKVLLHSPSSAIHNGIGMIYQELSLALPISIAENILVGRLPRNKGIISKKKMADMARELLAKVGLEHLDPTIPISEISQHEAQLVEIAKALGNNPHILVMDEPTSALSREEVELLFDIIGKLKEQGIAVVYISHHLPEVFQVADRVTVLRDGKKIGTEHICNVTTEKLVEMMVGRSIMEFYKKRESDIGGEMFRVEHLTRNGFFHDISFHVNKGEILGICGLAGAGRTELARAIVGADYISSGKMFLEGEEITCRNMDKALSHGIAYLTENRKTQGLALRMTVEENIVSALLPKISTGGIYMRKKGKPITDDLINRLKIYPPETSRMVSTLSGGNQQKVLLAKWLALQPRLLILDEPTRGVDIGAKMLIHEKIEELADNGHAIILISSDLPELVGLSDRAMIMRSGHFIGEMKGDDITEESLLLEAYKEERKRHASCPR